MTSRDYPASNTKTQCVFVKATLHSLPLPKEYHQKNVLVELLGNGKSKSHAYYSNAMTVQVIENYGQVRVTRAANARAIPKTYVKVYAMLANGQVKFYKDGYTDLRGRFDFTSLNTNELDNVDADLNGLHAHLFEISIHAQS